MKLSVCMIVKNEAKMLEKTLPSLSQAAAEIIVLDTGSSDDTAAVARKYGARVSDFTWIDDFSAARNESLKQATGDWILWADADEYYKPEDLDALKQQLAEAADPVYELTIYESKPGRCDKNTGFQRAKVFRNGQGFHFIRPINEQLVDAKGRVAKGELLPVSVYHWGRNLAGEAMNEKRRRYIELYSRALEQNGNDPYLHYMLATNLNELKRLDEALAHFDRTLGLVPDKAIGRQALEKKADILLRQKKLPEAAQAAQLLLNLDKDNVPARNVLAAIYLYAGKIDLAIEVLEEALRLKVEGRVENKYVNKAMPNFLLSKAYALKGDQAKAADHLAEYKRIMG
ncbi:MAG: glycosyltransferase [Candidatus Saganbacteria bacterium]|nr:glycosyltransferase [Candidatus Saganbacteria bacterium]